MPVLNLLHLKEIGLTLGFSVLLFLYLSEKKKKKEEPPVLIIAEYSGKKMSFLILKQYWLICSSQVQV